MEEFRKEKQKRIEAKRKIFTIPLSLVELKEKTYLSSNRSKTPSKEEINDQPFKYNAIRSISESEENYQTFINKGLNDPQVLINYGIICKQENKINKAIEIYKKAIELFPDEPKSYSCLGIALIEIGKLKEAELSINKAIKLKSNSAIDYSNLATIKIELGKLEEAEFFIKKAIGIKPDYADAYLNLGIIEKLLGKYKEAEISIKKALSYKPNFAEAYISLGNISKELNNLEKAEEFTRKAIEIDSKLASAHYNLGAILIDKGNLTEAEISIRKSLSIKSNLSKAYVTLSELRSSSHNNEFRRKLFSNEILESIKEMDKVDIYFARSNILHNLKKYKESSEYLKKANQIKLNYYPSDAKDYLAASHFLLNESNKHCLKSNQKSVLYDSLFIVGMPRSGSTLLESILSMNNNVWDLGEVNSFQESFIEWKEQLKENKESSLAEIYINKILSITNNSKRITTNKSLYNYQYAGIIASQLINAKIIHCYRNPLDNILSIYRAHFDKGSRYSSSLKDCTKVYLDQEYVMDKYKNKYPKVIYSLNYDKLVKEPQKEIRRLIKWLSWEWDDKYLSPHINPRSIKTASSIQVRSPIHSKSVGLWKNYEELMTPSLNLFINNTKYQYLCH